jgi:methylated-DNA-protein-cysteine methyltransferase-like protein
MAMGADAARSPAAAANFYDRVFDIVARIPPGRVTTYGWIARAVGAPRSARVVGYALHAGVRRHGVPCHRVLNRDGELSGAWAWGDPQIMRQLLEGEGIEFDQRGRVNLQRFGWEPDEESWDNLDEMILVE